MALSSSAQLAHTVARLPDADLVEFWLALLVRLPESKRLEMAFRAAESLPATLGALRSLLAAEESRISTPPLKANFNPLLKSVQLHYLSLLPSSSCSVFGWSFQANSIYSICHWAFYPACW